ncbi:GreA/GreB family elongation factor [Leifsonia sp. YIM 134122]|uniref:GreA/GreB family elongation factor n=1 Tax=Leifsonia stereocauli TaxID=3134136 RepID=A0ABU9W1U8_9MICO
MTDDMIWLPPASLARLTEELAQLGSRFDPDQDTVDRMRDLRRTLRRAEASSKPDDGLVEPGMRVTVLVSGDAVPAVFLVGERKLAVLDPAVAHDVLSPSSPLGAAVMGSHPGDTVTYVTPAGESRRVEVLAAVPYNP